MEAIIIPADSNLPVSVEAMPQDQLKFLQAKVGGWITTVGIGLPGITGWVDDEGLLKGKAINLRATLLCGQHLAGDLVLTGVDGGGETVAIPTDLIEAIRKAL